MKWLRSVFAANSRDNVNYAEKTHIGGRTNNQDYCAHLFTEAGDLLVVADGLGGHEGGELASKHFCESLISFASDNIDALKQSPEKSLAKIIDDAVALMRSTIQQQHPGVDAHTTCAIAWIDKTSGHITSAHVGDSRIYIFDKKTIHWRSRDHSVVQILVDLDEVNEEEMGHHPEQGQLTRSISMEGEIKPSIKSHAPFAKKQTILLCSDGFWEQILTRDILSLAKTRSLDKRLEELLETAVKRGGKKGDNVTVQVWRN